jgi:hypothetical protein
MGTDLQRQVASRLRHLERMGCEQPLTVQEVLRIQLENPRFV